MTERYNILAAEVTLLGFMKKWLDDMDTEEIAEERSRAAIRQAQRNLSSRLEDQMNFKLKQLAGKAR